MRSNHISKWFSGRIVTDDKVGESFKQPTGWLEKDVPWTPEEARRANQGAWNHKARLWQCCYKRDNGDMGYLTINIDTKNKWLVSDGNLYEYLIFDLIHILKIFDWENDELICIGG